MAGSGPAGFHTDYRKWLYRWTVLVGRIVDHEAKGGMGNKELTSVLTCKATQFNTEVNGETKGDSQVSLTPGHSPPPERTRQHNEVRTVDRVSDVGTLG